MRIKPEDRVKTRAVRVSLKVFVAEPSLGKCQAKALFAEILAHIKTGMDDEQIIQQIIGNHKTNAPKGQLLLM